MALSDQLVFLISAVGAINGFALSIYLMVKPRGETQVRFLGLLVLAVSIRVGKSVFFFFNPDLAKIYLQIGLGGCFFIGPFCLFYILAETRQYPKLLNTWHYHLGLLAVGFISFGALYPYQEYPQLWTYVVRFIYGQWAFYLLASTLVLWQSGRSALVKGQFAVLKPLHSHILLGCWVLWCVYAFSHFTSYLAGALIFTFLLYLTGFVSVAVRYRSQNKRSVPYEHSKIAPEQAQSIITELTALMEEEQLYLNANLTLPVVAKRLGITPQRLSQILNDNMGLSFSTYLNQYRIDSAKTILSQGRSMKMEVLAESCGFNTQSTFYKAFKEITQTTPAKYRAQSRV